MKTIKTLLLLCSFIFLFACHGSHDDDGDYKYNDTKIEEGGPNDEGNKIVPSSNEIIVKFDPALSEEDRALIRADFPFAEAPRGCSCGDTTIELWTINTDAIDIEGAVRNLKSRGGEEGVEGDRGFDILLTDIPNFTPLGQQGNAEPLVAAQSNTAVNIAVLDTGIDFERDLTPTPAAPYLFRGDAFSDCYPNSPGWNFVDNSFNIIDYHGHGTYVTKIIRDILNDVAVDYSILPLKVFDDSGRGSYWDVVCAMGYIKDINAQGGNISLVNTSFGGQQMQEILQQKTVLSGILDDLKEQTLIIASAGNRGFDTDDAAMGHFLTSYPLDNILAVGGYDIDGDGNIILDDRSNYGATSIDLALAFSGYTVVLNTLDATTKDRASLKGTSYAAAAMTGLAAKFYIETGMPNTENLKNGIFSLTQREDGLNGKIAGNRIILR